MEENRVTKLNVAGSRESKEPGIYLWVLDIIKAAVLRKSIALGTYPGNGSKKCHPLT